jgi:hypothetical protein
MSTEYVYEEPLEATFESYKIYTINQTYFFVGISLPKSRENPTVFLGDFLQTNFLFHIIFEKRQWSC